MKTRNLLLKLLICPVLLVGLASAENKTGWWFGGGAVYRGGATYSLEGSSVLQEEGRSAVQTGVSSPLGDVGSAGAPANRTYDDGFVRIGPNLAGVITPNLTTHWGYQNNSQRSGRDLTFTRTGPQGLTRVGEESRSLSEDESIGSAGVELLAGKPLRIREDSRWDLVTGLRIFFPGSQTVGGVARTEDFRGQIVQIVDTYRLDDIQTSAGSVTPDPPPAPFTGSASSGILKNAIPNIPTNRNVRTLAAGDWQAETQVQADIDAMHYELRFGAQWSRQLGEQWSLTLQPTISAHILDVDISRRETVVARYADGSSESLFNFSEDKSTTEVLFGASLQAGISHPLNDRWDLDLSLGYDYVEESSVRVGPNTVKMDLSGYTAGIAFRRGFGGAE